MDEVCKFSEGTWWDGYAAGKEEAKKEVTEDFIRLFKNDWETEKSNGTQSMVDWMDAVEKIAGFIADWKYDETETGTRVYADEFKTAEYKKGYKRACEDLLDKYKDFEDYDEIFLRRIRRDINALIGGTVKGAEE